MSQSSSNEHLDLNNPRDFLFEPNNSLHHKPTSAVPFEVHFLGHIQDVNLGGKHHRDPDWLLIDKLEEGQVRFKHHSNCIINKDIYYIFSHHFMDNKNIVSTSEGHI